MGEITPESPPSSTGLRVAVAVLAVALAGAGAYIVYLRGQLAQLAAAPAPRRVAPAAAPAAAPAGAPAAAPAVAGTPSEEAIAAVLTEAQQQAMIGALQADSSEGRKAWFQVQQNNAETAAVQTALQRVFEKAGWPTETVRRPYLLKKGIFMLAGEEQPPPFTDTVSDAFTAAGLDLQYLTGYRAFFAERKQQNPNWVGPELASDQAFIIVVGSQPTPKAAAAEGGESSAP